MPSKEGLANSTLEHTTNQCATNLRIRATSGIATESRIVAFPVTLCTKAATRVIAAVQAYSKALRPTYSSIVIDFHVILFVLFVFNKHFEACLLAFSLRIRVISAKMRIAFQV